MGDTGAMGAMAPSGYGEMPGPSIPSGAPSAAGTSNWATSAANSPYAQAAGAGVAGLGSVMGWIQNMQRDKAAAAQAAALSDPAQLMKGFPTDPAFVDPINRALNANAAVRTGGASGGFLNQFIADAWVQRYMDYMANRINALKGAGGIYQGQPTQPTNQLGNVLGQLGVLGRIGQQAPPPAPSTVAFSGPGTGFSTAPEYGRLAMTEGLYPSYTGATNY